MKPFTHLTGTAAPLPIANVDTDMIIPKQFLKTVSREGLAKGLFYELKTKPDGSPNPERRQGIRIDRPSRDHGAAVGRRSH